MKKTFTILLSSFALCSFAQTQIANPGFETWGNTAPGVAGEPTGWYSNKSGSNVAQLSSAICFQDNTIKHTGAASVRVETISYFGTAVNGAVTTGVINAPNTTKSNGYIGTVNYSTSSDDRRLAFTGRPDSLVGYYQYTSGGAGEQGKVTAILHTGDYFDPELPTTYHPDPTANKIARALFFTPTSNVATWTRFSVPFSYTSSATPAYIMVNITSSANQATTITGSKLWIDDLEAIYNPAASSIKENDFTKNVKVYYCNKTIFVDFLNKDNDQSTLEIYNATGQLVSTQAISNNTTNTMDVSTLSSGVYMYKVTGKSQGKFGKLFID
jgi:hypothetical protein